MNSRTICPIATAAILRDLSPADQALVDAMVEVELSNSPDLDDLTTGDWDTIPDDVPATSRHLWAYVHPVLMTRYSPEEVTRYVGGRAMEEGWESASIYGVPDEDGR
jgi:hypothetical protein